MGTKRATSSCYGFVVERWSVVAAALACVGGCTGDAVQSPDEGGNGGATNPTGTPLDSFASGTTGDDDETGSGPKFDIGDNGAQEPEPPPVVLAETPPPPISGGSLLLSRDGTMLFAADPARNSIFVVDVEERKLVHRIQHGGCEPGRLAEGDDGSVYVACRRSGELLVVDPVAGERVRWDVVCGNPRGLAVDPTDDTVWVACAEGTLARVVDGEVTSSIEVDAELRDIVDLGPPVRVSTFRSAELLTLDALGGIESTQRPSELLVRGSGIDTPGSIEPADDGEPVNVDDTLRPNTSRHTKLDGRGEWFMLHQAGSSKSLDDGANGTSSGWGGDCISIQTAVLTRETPQEETPHSTPLIGMGIVFDAAVDTRHESVAAVGAAEGEWGVFIEGETDFLPTVVPSCVPFRWRELGGPPSSVVFDNDGFVWVQLAEPAQLLRFSAPNPVVTDTIALSSIPTADTGFDLFHVPTDARVACVSCHPEGLEDRLSWVLETGEVRTQSLAVSLAEGAPHHWRGEMDDIDMLFHEIFVDKMQGPTLTPEHVAALERWLFALTPPNPNPNVDTDAAERGAEIFETAGCAVCHVGPRLSNDATVDFGSLGMLQVPSLLGVARRDPFMHDGRALDLDAAVSDMLDRTTVPSMPSDLQRADLVEYLRSL